jgi:trimethylamine:corrinoid methyltransferase-like protein
MARTSRRRGGRKAIDAKAATIRQIDKKVLRNGMAPLEPLDEEQLEIIHNMSLRILEELGIEVAGEQALNLFRKAGASVDSNGVVRIERELLLDAVALAPERFAVTPRNVDQTQYQRSACRKFRRLQETDQFRSVLQRNKFLWQSGHCAYRHVARLLSQPDQPGI